MKDRGSRVLWLIGGFKLAKGLLLLAVGLGALRLLHHDVADALASLAAQLHVDPDNRYVDRAFTALLAVDDRRLKEISAGTFFYAALLLTEGTGLLLERRWAEYFTVLATGSFIPLELYELAKHVTFTRLALLAVNIAIVWYLVVRLRRDREGTHATGAEMPGAPPPRATPPRASCPSALPLLPKPEEPDMTTNTPGTYALDVEDVEYLRHGDRPLLARLFKPRGAGPFPLIVELHGGAWCRGDRLNDAAINEPLARSGVTVAALDFRMPPEAPYPASLVDINYAVRWLKARAEELRSRPDLVGILGSSSGAHQAMLTAMRPRDGRYAAVPLPVDAAGVDASVRGVVLCWPVIDPLARYRYAKTLKESGGPYPEIVDRVLPLHDQYWRTEEAMAEGNPVLALERGERVDLPPVLYLQGTRDAAHPRPDLDRFVGMYRAAGGEVEVELYEGEAEGFITRNPASRAAARAIEAIIEWVHKKIR